MTSSTQHRVTELVSGQAATGTEVGPWRMRRTRDGTPRSLAWVFYALLSSLGAIVLLSHPPEISFWVVETLLLLYTRYLYRGGRWVFLFWVW